MIGVEHAIQEERPDRKKVPRGFAFQGTTATHSLPFRALQIVFLSGCGLVAVLQSAPALEFPLS